MDITKYQDFANTHFGDFGDINLLVTAFTHRSYLNEHKKNRPGAQRAPGIFGRRRAGDGSD